MNFAEASGKLWSAFLDSFGLLTTLERGNKINSLLFTTTKTICGKRWLREGLLDDSVWRSLNCSAFLEALIDLGGLKKEKCWCSVDKLQCNHRSEQKENLLLAKLELWDPEKVCLADCSRRCFQSTNVKILSVFLSTSVHLKSLGSLSNLKIPLKQRLILQTLSLVGV